FVLRSAFCIQGDNLAVIPLTVTPLHRYTVLASQVRCPHNPRGSPAPMLLTIVTFLTMALLNPARSEARVAAYPRLHAAGRRDRILIVAPHIDDEAIGAGGYAIDAVDNGAEVFIVFLTAGDCNRFS